MPTSQASVDHKRLIEPVAGIHHIEFYVSNDVQAAHFYRSVLGLSVVGAIPADFGRGDQRSMVLERGEIRVLLTAPVTGTSPVAEHIRLHGEGVKDVAFLVRDVDDAFARATRGGAVPLQQPATESVDGGAFRSARVGAYGALVHSLIAERPRKGAWLPGMVPLDERAPVPDTGLESVDHIALALGGGELDPCVEYYRSAFGFHQTHQEDVNTASSGMRSIVVGTLSGSVRLPLMEPVAGKVASQIDRYVKSHEGAGAQHVAFRSHDIVKSVTHMADSVAFLPTPATYYDTLESRVGDMSTELQALQRLGILVDRDDSGLLLQVFTRPIGSRPTLFLEVVERRGALGFGGGNIKALFEAVERMQVGTPG